MSFFGELKRRNVFRVGAAYLAAVWLVIQVADVILPTFAAPAWVLQALIFALALGFPCTLALAWFYELTPDGVKAASEIPVAQAVKFTGRKLDFAIIGLLMLAVGFLLARDHALDQFADRFDEDSSQASIAVLPFANSSGDTEQAYFSDGVAEDILSLLAQVPEFRVSSRASSFAFRGEDTNIPAVATKLNVSHILTGSVRMAGNEVRVSTQLVNARTDSTIWAQTYDRTLDDIFAIQNDIAAAVLNELRIVLLGTAPETPAIDPEAYRLFLQAKHILDGDESRLELLGTAERYLHEALALEPDYGRALLELARVYHQQGRNDKRPWEEALRLAYQTLNKAQRVDPNNGLVYAWLIYLNRRYDGDVPALARDVERALELLNPTNVSMFGDFGSVEMFASLEDSITIAEYAVKHDPLCVSCYHGVGMLYSRAGRFDEAVASFRIAQSLDPNDQSNDELGDILLLKGDIEAALAEYEKEEGPAAKTAGLARAYYSLGRHQEFESKLAELRDRWGDRNPRLIASVYAYAGQVDAAFEWLERLPYAQPRADHLLLHVDPFFDSLHEDPRWDGVLRRIGIAPDQLAALNFHTTLPR